MVKAQRTIDSVVGTRPPTFKDRAQLPYVEALVKEVMRWRTAGPLGKPNLSRVLGSLMIFQVFLTWPLRYASNLSFSRTDLKATQDVEYEGYVIPKGSYLIPNAW